MSGPGLLQERIPWCRLSSFSSSSLFFFFLLFYFLWLRFIRTRSTFVCVMTSSYAHVMDRPSSISSRLDSPLTSNLDTLQAKKNFSVSHLLDLEEAGEMVGAQPDEGVGEAGRSLLESPGLTSGSDTTQQESKCPSGSSRAVLQPGLG